MSQSQFARSAIRLAVFALLVVSALHFGVAAATTKKPPPHPININSASSEELQQVPGIGPSTAEKILQMRKSYGAFKSVDDLKAVRGIGPKRMEKMRKYLTTGKPGTGSPRPATPGKSSARPAQPANCGNCAKPALATKGIAPLPVKAPAKSKPVNSAARTDHPADNKTADCEAEEPESL